MEYDSCVLLSEAIDRLASGRRSVRSLSEMMEERIKLDIEIAKMLNAYSAKWTKLVANKQDFEYGAMRSIMIMLLLESIETAKISSMAEREGLSKQGPVFMLRKWMDDKAIRASQVMLTEQFQSITDKQKNMETGIVETKERYHRKMKRLAATTLAMKEYSSSDRCTKKVQDLKRKVDNYTLKSSLAKEKYLLNLQEEQRCRDPYLQDMRDLKEEYDKIERGRLNIVYEAINKYIKVLRQHETERKARKNKLKEVGDSLMSLDVTEEMEKDSAKILTGYTPPVFEENSSDIPGRSQDTDTNVCESSDDDEDNDGASNNRLNPVEDGNTLRRPCNPGLGIKVAAQNKDRVPDATASTLKGLRSVSIPKLPNVVESDSDEELLKILRQINSEVTSCEPDEMTWGMPQENLPHAGLEAHSTTKDGKKRRGSKRVLSQVQSVSRNPPQIMDEVVPFQKPDTSDEDNFDDRTTLTSRRPRQAGRIRKVFDSSKEEATYNTGVNEQHTLISSLVPSPTSLDIARVANVCVIATTPYKAQSKDELSLKIGQKVKQKLPANNTGYAYGWTRQNKMAPKKYGLYPASCVTVREKLTDVRDSFSRGN